MSGGLLSIPWDIVSTIAVLILLVLTLVELVKKHVEFRKLKNPVEAHFLILAKEKYDLNYVKQDNNEHYVDTLVLPSNATIPMLIWYKPKLNFHESEQYFGCEGKSQEKPIPLSYFNPFIVDGEKETSPKKNPLHYRDFHQYYHIKTDKPRTKDEKYVGGFKLKTRKAGTYEANLYFHTPTRVGKASLSIKVEDKPLTKMRCVQCQHHIEAKAI